MLVLVVRGMPALRSPGGCTASLEADVSAFCRIACLHPYLTNSARATKSCQEGERISLNSMCGFSYMVCLGAAVPDIATQAEVLRVSATSCQALLHGFFQLGDLSTDLPTGSGTPELALHLQRFRIDCVGINSKLCQQVLVTFQAAAAGG